MPLKTRRQAAKEAEMAQDVQSDQQEEPESPPTPEESAAEPASASETDASEPKGNHNGRAVGASAWKPWEDRTLAQEVQAVRPWNASRSGGGKSQAWVDIALRAHSAQAAFKRNGPACKDHFKKMLQAHRRGELRAKQTSGEGGEIDQFIETMTDIDTQLWDHEATKATASETTKEKQRVERQAGLAMQAAATKSLVRREELDDITRIAGSTQREKSGQRKRPQLSRSPSSLANQSPQPVTKQKRTNYRKDIKTLMEDRQEADNQLLEEARKTQEETRQVQEEQHQEVTSAIKDMSKAIQNLADVIAEDRKAQRAASSDQTLLLSVIEKMAKPS